MIKYKFLTGLLLAGMFVFHSCDWDEPTPEDKESTEFNTGLDHIREAQEVKYIPSDLSLVTLSDASVVIHSSVTLEPWIPPVLSQGRYGTCTAWACGYFARTIMYARENNLSKADLEDKKNVFSPLDLFLSIEHRGTNCNGSSPRGAFEVMQNRGIATFATAPYENLGDCSSTPPSVWNSEAAHFKIDKYRKVNHEDVQSVKSYVQMGRPVQVSCVLGKNFFNIRDGSVLYDDDYSAPVEQHGRHAMVVVGYDDDKGANGAFLIVNSWGTNWGDKGYFWVDYKFFAEKFCYQAYVIDGDKGGLSEAVIDESVINPNYRVAGKDLLAIKLVDVYDDHPGNPPQSRALTYNVFNRGQQAIPASDKWNIVYYYYNAFNPENDFGIIIYDSYTDEIGSPGEHGDFEDLTGTKPPGYGEFNWWNNVDIPSGYSTARAVYGADDGYDYDFVFYYQMPKITGDYYFVLYADGFNAINEQFEQNNFMFFTGADKKPLKIVNGVIQETGQKSAMANGGYISDLKRKQPNAYGIDEIASLVHYQKRTGILEQKMMELKNRPASVTGGRGYTGRQIVKSQQ